MQSLLKLDIASRLQRHAVAQKPKSTFSSLAPRFAWPWSAAVRQLPDADTPAEALAAAPGRDFEHVGAPGTQAALLEAKQLLKRYNYKAELYGVKDRSADWLEAVLQPWYQTLLDMGSIQVASHMCTIAMRAASVVCIIICAGPAHPVTTLDLCRLQLLICCGVQHAHGLILPSTCVLDQNGQSFSSVELCIDCTYTCISTWHAVSLTVLHNPETPAF